MIFLFPINETRNLHWFASLNKFFAIYCQTSVGTNISAIGATCAIIGIFQIDIMVSLLVHLARLQFQHTFRTCYNTKIAALASFDVNLYITFYFLPLILKFFFYSSANIAICLLRYFFWHQFSGRVTIRMLLRSAIFP
jgi:hypothetical protein